MLDGANACFEFESVSFQWPGGRMVLNKQTFTLPGGCFCMVRGPSGSGKSTLLRLMNRLEDPQSGVIRYRNRALADWHPPRLRQKVACLQQMPVVPDVPVRDMLLLPFAFGVNKALAMPPDNVLAGQLDRVLLGDVGLDERAAALSGGQRQRLCLLRALMTGPEVLLLDEPTASLDRESKAVVEQMAMDLCTGGVTIIMVTHDDFSPRGVPGVTLYIREGMVTL